MCALALSRDNFFQEGKKKLRDPRISPAYVEDVAFASRKYVEKKEKGKALGLGFCSSPQRSRGASDCRVSTLTTV